MNGEKLSADDIVSGNRHPDYSVAWPKDVRRDGAVVKTYWVQCGIAWNIGDPREGKIKVVLDATPIGWDGTLVIFPRKP